MAAPAQAAANEQRIQERAATEDCWDRINAETQARWDRMLADPPAHIVQL